MAMRIIDTEDKILVGDNHPQLKIGDKLYVVDDRKSTWDKIQKLQEDENLEDSDMKVLELALGKEAVEEIFGKDITVEGYMNLTLYVMSAITGESFEELKKASRERKN